MIGESHNISPFGDCLDCGASAEEIQDGLVVCDKIIGQHAVALKAIARVIRERTHTLNAYRQTLAQNEDAIATLSKHLRKYEQELNTLIDSFAKLKSNS